MGNRALAVAKSQEDSVTSQGDRQGLRKGNLTVTGKGRLNANGHA